MDQPQQRIRKAAILVSSLDELLAGQLLRHLSTSQRVLVRREMENLGEIDASEQRAVIDEFFRVGPFAAESQLAGIELDGALAEMLVRGSPNASAARQASDSVETQPFRFLSDADVPSLVPFLEKERPQTIAVVLAYLPQDRAAQILTALRPALQVEVIQRLSDLDTADAESLRVVERELEVWVTEQSRTQKRRMAGLSSARGIVSAAGSLGEQTILRNLREHDDRLATKIAGEQQVAAAAPMLRWDDLADLDDASLAAIAREAEPELLVLALTDADGQLVDRVLRQLPDLDADSIASQIDRLGPTRLSDVEAAQRELVVLATRLIDRGEDPRQRSRLIIAA